MPSASQQSRVPQPDEASVRIEVRLGTDRPVEYEFVDSEFVIGGGAACDLRLPGSHLPAVICHIHRLPNALELHRRDFAVPLFLNGQVLGTEGPYPLHSGDVIAVGPADLTVRLPNQHIRPRFVPLPPEPPPATYVARPPADPDDSETHSIPFPAPDFSALAAEREELARWRSELEEQTRILEEDRIAWYRRRQEMEAEARQFRERPDLSARELDLVRREAELNRVRQEMNSIREGLVAQHERLALPSLAETNLAGREAELVRNRVLFQDERSRFVEDLLRQERSKQLRVERQRELDRRAEEIDSQYERLRRDAAELEEHVRLVGAEQDRNDAESSRLDRLRIDLEGQAGRLAERSAQVEAQQAMLAVLRARLDRRHDEQRVEASKLAADRGRNDDARRDLDDRLRDAERLRAELAVARDGQVEQESQIAERTAWLDATLAEIQQQKDASSAEQTRLAARELELDVRSADFAEQAAVLKARVSQVMDLQERLEADRTAVRERESTLTDADTARQTFQEQLRRRAEDLGLRTKQSDDLARRLADERAELDRKRGELDAGRDETERTFTQTREDLDRRDAELATRETSLERQVARLRDAGRGVAAARKELEAAKRTWEAERLGVQTQLDAAQHEWTTLRERASEELAALRKQTPDLEGRAQTAVETLKSAREVLRGHLGEMSTFAGQTRHELDALRTEVRNREQALEAARAEHRLAATEFRQQMLDWQSRVTELKGLLERGETRLVSREAEVQAAARHADATSVELARQAAELREERRVVADRRVEVERHLGDMREWYRRKLRELAESRSSAADPEPTILAFPGDDEVEPGDRQLGDLLRASDLVDAETLAGLWAEAQRQRRTLRQVLLASGAITLYQLALIEAGNLDGLVLGRLRVVDRLRVTARETSYRVFDPTRSAGPTRGVFVLRHLAEAEMDDAVRPDEFRQRFAAACEAAHPNLAATLEVLEIQGRPAVLQEWLSGVPGSEWPTEVAAPGVWVKLLSAAAAGLDAAHHGGLVHGRLTSDHLLLGLDGVLKITALADPPWLTAGPLPLHEPTPEVDLRALGQIAHGWSLLGTSGKKRGPKSKGFPDSLRAVIRRLEADPEPTMGDTMVGTVPYSSAGELAADLIRLAAAFPCPPDAWERLLSHIAENADDDGAEARKSA